jgi:quercetin dioxygenase-like cupin family protein
MSRHYRLARAAWLCAGLLLSASISAAEEEHVKPVFSQRLPNVPGKDLTAVVVSYPPGGKSPSHRHAGSVFAFVLSGAIRSQNSATGAERICRAGEGFFEPPGSTHLMSENASTTDPASLLAVFVADDGAVLTMPAKGQ